MDCITVFKWFYISYIEHLRQLYISYIGHLGSWEFLMRFYSYSIFHSLGIMQLDLITTVDDLGLLSGKSIAYAPVFRLVSCSIPLCLHISVWGWGIWTVWLFLSNFDVSSLWLILVNFLITLRFLNWYLS